MTKITETSIANGKAQILASLREHTDRLQAMPDEGGVLYNRTTHLALQFTDDDFMQHRVGGLPWARIFTVNELRHGRARLPHLTNAYRDGAGNLFELMSLAEAKALALESNAKAIALVDQHVADLVAAVQA